MSAQLLDNNKDGIVDDPALEKLSIKEEGMIVILDRDGSTATNHWYQHGHGGAVLFDGEVDPGNPGIFGKDATFEEVVHNINWLQFR